MAKIADEAAATAAALERLARLMRADEHADGLNPAQWGALRYLSRANRFSNSPGALTRYLGATKGTVSQTVIALERKGFVEKAVRESEKRSVSLSLTEKGRAALVKDPWARLQTAIDDLGEKTRRRMAKGARELLDAELARGSHAVFGACAGCRYFRERGLEDDARGPHQCMHFNAPVSKAEQGLICAEHAAGY